MGENERSTLEALLDSLDKEWSTSTTGNNNDWQKVDDGLMSLARARGLLERLDSSESTETLRTKLDKLDTLVAQIVSKIMPAGPAPPPGKNPISDLDKYLIKDEPTTSTTPPAPAPAPAIVKEEEYVPYQIKPKQEVRQRKPVDLARPTGTLEGTKQVQEELSHELAQMATQLKKNALHFSGSLEKDKAVLETADQQLNHNYDKMQKTQGLTKTMSSKRSGTTWFVFAIVIGVSVAFFFMVVLIRAT